MNHELNAILAIAGRDVTKLLRDRTRIIFSFMFPLIFIGILGQSLQANVASSLGFNLLLFTFIGVTAQTLFQSSASGIISLVTDRDSDFAQDMFVKLRKKLFLNFTNGTRGGSDQPSAFAGFALFRVVFTGIPLDRSKAFRYISLGITQTEK